MSTKSRNFRRRADHDDKDTPPPPPPPSSSSKPKPKKLLSFADDEDENDAVAIKPPKSSSSSSRLAKPSAASSSSHKLTSSKERLPPPSSNVQPQAGTYTKEALLQLQKNTRTLAYSKPPPSSSTPTPPPPPNQQPPKIILKGLLKPSSHQDADGLYVDDSDGGGPNHARQDDDDDADDENSFIPDEEIIKKIRAKRERMRLSRKSSSAPDYISLDGPPPLHPLSDDDDDHLLDREDKRIPMIGTKSRPTSNNHHHHHQEAAPVGVFQAVDSGDADAAKNLLGRRYPNVGPGDEDEDDEEKDNEIWEDEQCRKALGKRLDDDHPYLHLPSATPLPPPPPPAVVVPSRPPVIPSIGGASQPLHALSIPEQAQLALSALHDNFKRIKESHAKTVSSLAKADENLSSSLLNITALENSQSAAGEKFIFMQKLRHFVSLLCDFLKDKAPLIEELEERMQKLHEERASALLERRSADNDDEMAEVEAAVKAALLVFKERGNSPAMIAAATSAAQAASAASKEQTKLPVKLDEFGRDMNQQKRMDAKRRAEARQRKKAQFELKRLSSMEVDGANQKIEGESSTDESDNESAAYQSSRDSLLQVADQIFSDASEEYAQLSLVKERFETWKKEYATTYRDAYMSDSAPAIFSPYVRRELLKWDPLHEDADFFKMEWHSLLFNYGMRDDGSDFSTDDADSNLVPELVEKVAIPILHQEIVHCWDMLSTRETKNAVSATILVTNYVPASSEALANLLVAVHTRLADAVANITVPTWSPLVLKAVPSAARVVAYRFGVSIRLMRNICLWKEILALPVLEKLVLDELLSGKVLPHIWSIASDVHDAVTRTERIVAALSGVWGGQNVTGGHSRKLQPLVDFVISLGRTLEKRHASGVSGTETGGLARRLKAMLVELNDYDNARAIARTFHLKEAL
ncbi:hypothetical protein Tsubulata_032799 [Turnera subulata]|uniref:GCF C-terminal domain-containing protein n=1 Tax=Turnera subulata TaxID=218843 RepID=A0A9Q0G5X9_9ROSI|nr:hypothetical protein Tsubulata_032799 [Turnera subulata]